MGHADPVTPALREEVLRRDRYCIAYRMDREHLCLTIFGQRHRPDDRQMLTLDHVHLHPGGTKGKRAPSRPQNLVAACGAFNNKPPNKVEREGERGYLLTLYPGSTCCSRRAA